VATGVIKSHFLWAPTQGLGADFTLSVWGPVHALVHGIDPFLLKSSYETRYHYPAALYTPDIYLIMAPAVFVPVRAGAVILFSAMLALTWGTVLVVIRPWTTGRLVAGALLGALVLFSLSSELGLSEGQPTALLAFGIALAIRAAIRGDTGWIAVIGVAIALFKVQTGLPIILVLLAMGAYVVVVRSIVLTLLLSLPGLIAEVIAAHGIFGLLRSWRTNLQFFNSLNSTASVSIRLDLAGTVYRLDHYDVIILQAIFLILLSVLALTVIRHLEPECWMWPFVGSFIVLVLYHQQYDLLIALLCFVPILLEPHSYLDVRLISFGLLVVDLVFRPAFAFYGGISTLTTFGLLAILLLVAARALAGWRSQQLRTTATECPPTVVPKPVDSMSQT
jgi:hypothetical protein